MDFGCGWPTGPLSPSAGPGADLNLLGDNLLIDLDDKTLQCLMGGPTGFAFSAGTAAAEAASGSGKRGREAEGEIAPAPAEEDEDCDSDEGAATRGGGCRGRGKRAKGGGGDAASVKAHREKARRERLNECFEELARLCDPSGKMTRTDRISIVQDAIRALGAVRVENNQLRQLNKFLEERVRHLETARAQGMYQHAMLAQQQQAQQQQQTQQLMLAQQQHQQQQQHQHIQVQALGHSLPQGDDAPPAAQQQQLGLAANGSGPLPASQQAELPPAAGSQEMQATTAQPQALQQPRGGQQGQAGPGVVPPGMMLVPMPATASAAGPSPPHAFYGMKAEGMEPSLAPSGSGSGSFMGLVGGAANGGGFAMAAGLGGAQQQGGPAGSVAVAQQVLPASAPPVSWLPAPDISHDQKLRPPAA